MAGQPDFTAVLPAINFGYSSARAGARPACAQPASCPDVAPASAIWWTQNTNPWATYLQRLGKQRA
jgi:hypothetical protein